MPPMIPVARATPASVSLLEDEDFQVNVTLTALDGDLTRRFTLTKEKPEIQIGRSSKNAARGMEPLPQNVYVDSPIMSREHAVLYKGESKERPLYLKDTKSTHGTFLGLVKAFPDHRYLLKNHDTLKFGIAVVTGKGKSFMATVTPLGRAVQSEANLKLVMHNPKVFRVNYTTQDTETPTVSFSKPTEVVDLEDEEDEEEDNESRSFRVPSMTDSDEEEPDKQPAQTQTANAKKKRELSVELVSQKLGEGKKKETDVVYVSQARVQKEDTSEQRQTVFDLTRGATPELVIRSPIQGRDAFALGGDDKEDEHDGENELEASKESTGGECKSADVDSQKEQEASLTEAIAEPDRTEKSEKPSQDEWIINQPSLGRSCETAHELVEVTTASKLWGELPKPTEQLSKDGGSPKFDQRNHTQGLTLDKILIPQSDSRNIDVPSPYTPSSLEVNHNWAEEGYPGTLGFVTGPGIKPGQNLEDQREAEPIMEDAAGSSNSEDEQMGAPSIDEVSESDYGESAGLEEYKEISYPDADASASEDISNLDYDSGSELEDELSGKKQSDEVTLLHLAGKQSSFGATPESIADSMAVENDEDDEDEQEEEEEEEEEESEDDYNDDDDDDDDGEDSDEAEEESEDDEGVDKDASVRLSRDGKDVMDPSKILLPLPSSVATEMIDNMQDQGLFGAPSSTNRAPSPSDAAMARPSCIPWSRSTHNTYCQASFPVAESRHPPGDSNYSATMPWFLPPPPPSPPFLPRLHTPPVQPSWDTSPPASVRYESPYSVKTPTIPAVTMGNGCEGHSGYNDGPFVARQPSERSGRSLERLLKKSRETVQKAAQAQEKASGSDFQEEAFRQTLRDERPSQASSIYRIVNHPSGNDETPSIPRKATGKTSNAGLKRNLECMITGDPAGSGISVLGAEEGDKGKKTVESANQSAVPEQSAQPEAHSPTPAPSAGLEKKTEEEVASPIGKMTSWPSNTTKEASTSTESEPIAEGPPQKKIKVSNDSPAKKKPSAFRTFVTGCLAGGAAGAITVVGAAAVLLATMPADITDEALSTF